MHHGTILRQRSKIDDATVYFLITDPRAKKLADGFNALIYSPILFLFKAVESLKDIEDQKDLGTKNLVIITPYSQRLTQEISPDKNTFTGIATAMVIGASGYEETLYP